MELTVCLLTRNDEANLERVLPSVAGTAQQVIIADTGSTDGTLAAAQRLGAQVVSVGWDDDFSAGRNQALAQARGEWILWLNPDEELDAAGRVALQACLREPTVLGWYLRVAEYSRPDAGAFTETIQLRMFRNGLGLRYRGRLHPTFETPLEDLARQRGQRTSAANVGIRRYAYLSTLTPDKLRWAARLLEKELQDRPGQLHYLIEYGRTLLQLRDERGHAVMAEAARHVLEAAAAPTAPVATVGALLEYVLTAPNAAGNSPLSRDQAKELARRWFPVTPPVLWALASVEFHAGRFADAIPTLEHLIHLGVTGRYDRGAAFEPTIIGGLAWENLGICFARLGDLVRAEMCFRKLLSLPGFLDKGRRRCEWVEQQKKVGVESSPS